MIYIKLKTKEQFKKLDIYLAEQVFKERPKTSYIRVDVGQDKYYYSVELVGSNWYYIVTA